MNITQELPAEQIVSKRGRVTIVILSGIERSVVAVMSIKRSDNTGHQSGTAEFTLCLFNEEAKLFFITPESRRLLFGILYYLYFTGGLLL